MKYKHVHLSSNFKNCLHLTKQLCVGILFTFCQCLKKGNGTQNVHFTLIKKENLESSDPNIDSKTLLY